jgi:hypothetical protein
MATVGSSKIRLFKLHNYSTHLVCTKIRPWAESTEITLPAKYKNAEIAAPFSPVLITVQELLSNKNVRDSDLYTFSSRIV